MHAHSPSRTDALDLAGLISLYSSAVWSSNLAEAAPSVCTRSNVDWGRGGEGACTSCTCGDSLISLVPPVGFNTYTSEAVVLGVQAQMPLIEAQAPLDLQARAHLLMAETFLRSTLPEQLHEVKDAVESHLLASIAACQMSGWWTKEVQVVSLLAMSRRVWGDSEGSLEMAGSALELEQKIASAQQSCFV